MRFLYLILLIGLVGFANAGNSLPMGPSVNESGTEFDPDQTTESKAWVYDWRDGRLIDIQFGDNTSLVDGPRTGDRRGFLTNNNTVIEARPTTNLVFVFPMRNNPFAAFMPGLRTIGGMLAGYFAGRTPNTHLTARDGFPVTMRDAHFIDGDTTGFTVDGENRTVRPGNNAIIQRHGIYIEDRGLHRNWYVVTLMPNIPLVQARMGRVIDLDGEEGSNIDGQTFINTDTATPVPDPTLPRPQILIFAPMADGDHPIFAHNLRYTNVTVLFNNNLRLDRLLLNNAYIGFGQGDMFGGEGNAFLRDPMVAGGRQNYILAFNVDIYGTLRLAPNTITTLRTYPDAPRQRMIRIEEIGLEGELNPGDLRPVLNIEGNGQLMVRGRVENVTVNAPNMYQAEFREGRNWGAVQLPNGAMTASKWAIGNYNSRNNLATHDLPGNEIIAKSIKTVRYICEAGTKVNGREC